MDHDGIWGTDVETITMANLLNTIIYSYDVSQRAWVRYQPHNGTDVNTPGIVDTLVSTIGLTPKQNGHRHFSPLILCVE